MSDTTMADLTAELQEAIDATQRIYNAGRRVPTARARQLQKKITIVRGKMTRYFLAHQDVCAAECGDICKHTATARAEIAAVGDPADTTAARLIAGLSPQEQEAALTTLPMLIREVRPTDPAT